MNDISKKMKIDNRKLAQYGIYAVFLLLVIFFGLMRPDTFFTVNNMMIVLRQISINGILAIGMTFVIITGGIDLSVGSILAYSSIVAASFAHPGEYPLLVPVMIAIIIGALFGGINGFVISRGDIPPFVVTLSISMIARGLTQLFNGGRPVNDLDAKFNLIGGGSLFGIPIPIIIFLVVILVGAFILNKIKFGRYVLAIGGNKSTAEVSGINVKKIILLTYILSGVLSAVSGVVLTSRVQSALVGAGESYELDAIAAVVIGGTSMSGGKGTIYGTVIGVLIIGLLSNGLDLIGVSSNYQYILKGVIIISAVLFDKKSKGKSN